MIDRAPGQPHRCLADTPPGAMVRVYLIVFELVRCGCWELPLRHGDVLRTVGEDHRGVLVDRIDGGPLVVPHDCAHFIGVETLQGPLEDRGGGAAEHGPVTPGP